MSADNPLAMSLQLMGFHFVLLYVLIGSTRPISGGHFNPLISVLMAFWGVITPTRAALYIGAQLAGAAIGSGVQFLLLPPGLQDLAHAGVQAVPSDHTVVQAFAGEAVAAFILVLVIVTNGLEPEGDDSRLELSMAMTVPLLLYTVGPVSSMCINPARAFGPALATGYWEHHWVWWVAPLVGGFLAMAPYKYFMTKENGVQGHDML